MNDYGARWLWPRRWWCVLNLGLVHWLLMVFFCLCLCICLCLCLCICQHEQCKWFDLGLFSWLLMVLFLSLSLHSSLCLCVFVSLYLSLYAAQLIWSWHPLLLPRAFQEVNFLINRAHSVNVKLVLTGSLYGKSYFSKTKEVISNLTNTHGTILSGQTFVQKRLLDCGHFHGRIWPFFTLMAIFTHQTGVRIVSFQPIVAHWGEEDSHKKNLFVPLNFSMCH